MAKQGDLVYWDANVVIDCIEKNERYVHLEPILREAKKGKIKILASTVCIAEISKAPDEVVERFFNAKFVVLCNPSEDAMWAARKLRKLNLLTVDAIHIASAIEQKATHFLTNDGEGKRKKNTPLGVAASLKESLNIMTPEAYFQSLSTDARQDDIEEHEKRLHRQGAVKRHQN